MNERTTEMPATGIRSPQGQERPYTPPSDGQGLPMTGAPMEQFAERSARSSEPLTRTERLLVTMFVTMFATMLAAGALGFTTISGQLLDMQQQIGGVQTEIGNLRTEMHKEIGDLSERITRVEERIIRVEERITGIEDRITGIEERITRVEERITRVEERITGIEDRITGIETLIQTHLVPQVSVPPPAGP